MRAGHKILEALSKTTGQRVWGNSGLTIGAGKNTFDSQNPFVQNYMTNPIITEQQRSNERNLRQGNTDYGSWYYAKHIKGTFFMYQVDNVFFGTSGVSFKDSTPKRVKP